MEILFDEPVRVHYGFLWWNTQDPMEMPDLMETRGGQRNGLLGAAVAGVLSMVTATHTGAVRLRIEHHEQPPAPADDAWPDVVEASWVPRGPEALLSSFDLSWELRVVPTTAYRVRWCAANMDFAREHEHDEDRPEVAPDRYLLQLWPAPPGEDVVVRVGSAHAEYWHREAARTPAPPPMGEQALAEEHEAAADALRRAEQDRQQLLDEWGGTPPSERLAQVGGVAARQLARRDRALVDAIEAAGPDRQRHVAIEMAQHAANAVHGTTVDWSAALAAVDAGQPLPPPFDDRRTLRDAVHPRATHAVTLAVANVEAVGQRRTLDAGVCAISAVAAAADPDALRAALDAVEAVSWAEPDDTAFLRSVRTRLAQA